MRVMKLLCATALMALVGVAQAGQQASAERLTSLLGKSETMSGRFSQMTLDGSGSQLQESTGEMALKRPGKFYWHTDAPLEQELVSDGKTIWLYDPDLEQVTVQKLDRRLTHTPALLLSGNVSDISNNFNISHQEAGEVVDFTLEPKNPDTVFDSLRLSFRSGVLNDMQLIDSAGQRTNILFMGVKLNPVIPNDRFTFTIPEGVDVISE